MQNKNLRIRLTSFILSILVIFIHSFNIHLYPELEGTWIYWIEEFISNVIGWLAVPLFFMISGFFFFNNYDFSKTKSKFVSRIKGLLIPYLIWNTIYLCFFYLTTNNDFLTKWFSTPPLSLDFQTITRGILLYKYNVFYWYIYQLMLYVMLSPLLYIFLRKTIIACCLIVLIFVGNLYCNEIPALEGYGVLVLYFMFYLIGGFIAIYFKKLVLEKPSVPIKYVILIFGVLIICRAVVMQNNEGYLYYFIYLIDYIAAVLVLYVMLGYIKCQKDYTVFEQGFIIYTIHPIIVDTVMKIYASLFPHTGLHALLNYFLSASIGLLLSCTFGWLLKKYCKTLFCIMNGYR